jgi:hypothetical protein
MLNESVPTPALDPPPPPHENKLSMLITNVPNVNNLRCFIYPPLKILNKQISYEKSLGIFNLKLSEGSGSF